MKRAETEGESVRINAAREISIVLGILMARGRVTPSFNVVVLLSPRTGSWALLECVHEICPGAIRRLFRVA